MAKKYDVIIAGAGPAGLMAAKTAGEIGLKTAILERKTRPQEITRGCAMMFAVESGYYFAERMYFNEKNCKMIFPVNGFTVDYNGPTRNFYACHFYAPDGKTQINFGNYDERISMGDRGRLSFVFNKEKLLEGLMNDAIKNGVEVFSGINVTGVEKTADGVKVIGNSSSFKATFVIGADGLNSRVAELMGFNKERVFYGAPPALTYYVTGLEIPRSEALNFGTCFRPDTLLPITFFILPSSFAENEYWISAKTQEDFEYIIRKSVFSNWFPKPKVTRVLGYIFALWSPVSEPYKNNVLLAGDSAWFGEAEITGSMMCGWKAANSVSVALRDNKPNRDGVLSYIEWWKKSFPEFDDYRNLMMFMPFRRMFTEKELNYLYSLIKSPLRSNLNPFLWVRLIKKALEPMIPQIEKEMPSAAEKLERLKIDNVDNIMKNQ